MAAPAAATPLPPVSGFTTIWGFTINPMVIVLTLAIVAVIVLLWRAQKERGNDFDFWDLLMDVQADGSRKASVAKGAFMLTFALSSWVVVDQEIKGTLTDTIFSAYLLTWAGSLIASVIFKKTDMPELPHRENH